jgi:hypothetical protein
MIFARAAAACCRSLAVAGVFGGSREEFVLVADIVCESAWNKDPLSGVIGVHV